MTTLLKLVFRDSEGGLKTLRFKDRDNSHIEWADIPETDGPVREELDTILVNRAHLLAAYTDTTEED